MKRIYIFVTMLLSLASCGVQKQMVTVINNSDIDRVEEIVELDIENPDEYTLFTADGVQKQCQTTYDGKLIFAADVEAGSKTKYELRKGHRLPIDTLATGDVYPQWFDDFAWENDKIGFRTYSVKMGVKGAKLHGYDIFTKRYKNPVIANFYGVQFDKEYQRCIKEIKTAKPLGSAITYHVDHGFGMDYYKVGPTLGSGTAALVSNGEIAYPLYYEKCELLDKGGMRLTFRLTYPAVEIAGDMVTEVRTLTLDAGTNFNHIEVEYKGLTKKSAAVIGIVMHDEGKVSQRGKGYMAYAEPVHTYGWQTYNAVIMPEEMSTSVVRFDEAIGDAQGHIFAHGEYTPGVKFTYYMGAGWNRWGFAKPADWFNYVQQQQQKYAAPLEYEIK